MKCIKEKYQVAQLMRKVLNKLCFNYYEMYIFHFSKLNIPYIIFFPKLSSSINGNYIS